jgi:DNA polymerase III subunit epsilon
MLNLSTLKTTETHHAAPGWREQMAQRARETQHDGLKDFYSGFTIQDDTPLKDLPLLALDFETTGLDPDKDDLLSIGAIPFDTNRIQFGQHAYWVLKPAAKLQPETIAIHGITHSAVENAPELLDILPQLLAMMKNRIVVAHCASIEHQFLDAALKYRIGEGIVFPTIDTLGIEQSHVKAVNKNGIKGFFKRLFASDQSTPSVRLADSRTRYHLPFYKPHHALMDALACAELLQAQSQVHHLENHSLNQLQHHP